MWAGGVEAMEADLVTAVRSARFSHPVIVAHSVMVRAQGGKPHSPTAKLVRSTHLLEERVVRFLSKAGEGRGEEA
jgi:hypothetical protein